MPKRIMDLTIFSTFLWGIWSVTIPTPQHQTIGQYGGVCIQDETEEARDELTKNV